MAWDPLPGTAHSAVSEVTLEDPSSLRLDSKSIEIGKSYPEWLENTCCSAPSLLGDFIDAKSCPKLAEHLQAFGSSIKSLEDKVPDNPTALFNFFLPQITWEDPQELACKESFFFL